AATPTITQVPALLEADAFRVALERRIVDLDALERHVIRRAEIAATFGRLFLLRLWRIWCGAAELLDQLVELGPGLCKFELQLPSIYALGLRHDEAMLQQVVMLFQSFIRLPQLVTLGSDSVPLGGDGGEFRLQRLHLLFE